MSVQIREMTEADLPMVAALEAENFSMPWSQKGFADALCRDAGRLLGYVGVYCSLDEGEITNVSVDAAARRTGIGESLMTQLLERLQRRDVCRVLLEVRKSNTPAIRLYEKLGFSMLGIRRDFYERPREDACMMAYPTVSTGE
jgi:ribosomal-protein-alanine N-acetyltransferase